MVKASSLYSLGVGSVMTAYAILDVEIHDIETYMQYMSAVKPLIEQHGGRYLARGGEFAVIEGDCEPARLVLLEFPSMDAIEDFYQCAEYQGLKQLRESCSATRMVALQGC